MRLIDFRPTIRRTVTFPVRTRSIDVLFEDGLLEIGVHGLVRRFRISASSLTRGPIDPGQLDLFPETIPVKRWGYPYGA